MATEDEASEKGGIYRCDRARQLKVRYFGSKVPESEVTGNEVQ